MADDLTFSVINNTSRTLTALAVANGAAEGLTFAAGITRLSTSAGNPTVPPGATATIVMPGGAGGVILAEAASLVPVMGRIIDLNVTPDANFAPGTADTDAMGHALDLVRNVMAAPSSQLSIDLMKALGDARAAPDEARAEAILDTFFTSHAPYESVTAEGYGMMLGWVTRYAYIWALDASGKLGRSYDVQAAPYFGVNGTSLGTITLLAPEGRSAVADPADASSGLTITFTPAGQSAQTLTFADRSLSHVTDLTLLGTFVDPAWIATSGDAPVLSPVFAGTLNAKTVIAVPATAAASDNSASDGLSGLDIANLVIGIIGLISSLVTIVGGVLAVRAYARNKIARGQNLSHKDKALAEEAAKRVMKKLSDTYGEQLREVGSRSLIVEESDILVSDSLEIRSTASATLKKVGKAKARKIIEDSEMELDRIAEFSSSPEISEIATKLVQATGTIDSDPLGSANKVKESTVFLKEVLQGEKGSISAREFERSEEALKTVETETRVVEEIEKGKFEEIENGEEKQVEEGLPEEFLAVPPSHPASRRATQNRRTAS